jgi:hypothetical protein
VPDEVLLQPLSQGADVAFLVSQQLEHKYQFSSAKLLLVLSDKFSLVNDINKKDTMKINGMISFFIF